MVNPVNADYAIVAEPSLGPLFGQSYRNLHICDAPSDSSLRFACNDTYLQSGQMIDEYFAKQRDFHVSDIEVFQIADFQ